MLSVVLGGTPHDLVNLRKKPIAWCMDNRLSTSRSKVCENKLLGVLYYFFLTRVELNDSTLHVKDSLSLSKLANAIF